MRNIQWIPRLVLPLLLGLVAVVMLGPILLTITNSLMTEQELGHNYSEIDQMIDIAAGGKDTFINLKIIPDWITLSQYGQVLIFSTVFLKMFWNSAVLVVLIVVGQSFVASLAAYAFAKLRFFGRDKIFIVYLMTMLMPFQVTLVPNFIVIDQLGLMNHNSALILPAVFGAFGVFMMRQFMAHIPRGYFEAAMMDGGGQWTIFWKIMMPLVKPGLAALVVLLFVDNWNMIEQPLIFLKDMDKMPLSLYLAQINTSARGIGFAASTLYMAPMILLFLYAESYFVKGIQSSGIKG